MSEHAQSVGYNEDLSKLLSFIAEGLILFDKQGVIQLINPHASLLLDRTEKEMIGAHVDEVVPIYLDESETPEPHRITSCVFDEGKTFSTPAGSTIYFKRESGGRFPVFVSAKNIEIEGENRGILIFRDITTEKELANYKENTALRLAGLTPILQQTAMGDFTTVLDIPPEEDEFTELLVGLQLMIDDLLDMTNKTKQANDERLLEVKRSEKVLEEKVARKTAELKHANIHIETILENLSSGLIEYDSAFRVKRMNVAAERFIGVKRKQVLGKQVLPEDKDTAGLESLAIVSYPVLSPEAKKVNLDSFGVNTGVHELKISKPAERELQIVTIPLTNLVSGERDGFIKVLRDITREKNISRSKSEFISIAAHQLRTPLSAVKWVLSMIIDGDVGPISDDQIKLLRKGFTTNEKMIGLVNDLLNVARIEEGRFGYEFAPADIIEVVRSVADDHQIVAEEAGVRLTVASPESQLEFTFDPMKLRLALENLVSNAIKYTPKDGKVLVKVQKSDDFATITVTDNGCGIPAKQLDRMFTKFFRAENVIRRQVSGTGLGLFIVKNIIARHGGTITVQSVENEGSTFTVKLPIREGYQGEPEIVE